MVESLHGDPHGFLDLHCPVLLVGADGEMQAEQPLADLLHLQTKGELAIVIRGRERDPARLLRMAGMRGEREREREKMRR
jgi:hypothetical protein